MSTISFTLQTQALDFSPLTRGQIDVVFNDGNQDLTLTLRLIDAVAPSGYFQEVAWDGTSAKDEEQAINYALAFTRDYKTVGAIGSNPKNLVAQNSTNTVTITATNGTFVSASYTGNVLVFGGVTINNSVQTVADDITATITDTGDCTEIEYNVSAVGDNSPFRLVDSDGLVNASWDGTLFQHALPRGTIQNLRILNPSTLVELDSVQLIVPRKLKEGDFSLDIQGYEDTNTSDIIITRDIIIANTGTIEYSLEESTATSGSNYSTSTTIAGISPGTYRLFIKDKYNCEIYKTVVVSDFQDSNQVDQIRYFTVKEGQTIIFKEFVDHTSLAKKNYFNTGSYNEVIQGARHRALHVLDSLDPPGENNAIGIQFKSSYTYHYVTIHDCDGNKTNVPFALLSNNLGYTEKFDCVVFPLETGQTGVYFNGGNEYSPNTETVIGSSPYDGTTPTWAEIGQRVKLNDAILNITGTGYDQNRGGYFIVDIETASEGSATVQVTYNKQLYNTYEAYFTPSMITSKSVIIIEKGFSADEMDGNPWVSEQIIVKDDVDDRLLLQWGDTKNRADIVFQSGIEFFARLNGELIADWENASETFAGDSNEFSLEQTRRLGFEIYIEGITTNQITQLNIASATTGFKANGISLVAKSIESKRLDKSNLYTWRGKFGYGINLAAIQQDEIVLSASTGVEGGGGTGTSTQIDLSGITLYKTSDGSFVKSTGGKLLKTN